jgi:hypothetical protein
MKSEEIAVLRILFKYKKPMKLSKLVEGFPDDSRNHVLKAVSRLQKLSFISLIDCSSLLYVSINRHMRNTVLELLSVDSQKYAAMKDKEERVLLADRIAEKEGHQKNGSKILTYDNGRLSLALPMLAIKITATMLLFSIVIFGMISSLSSYTASPTLYTSNDLPFIFTSSSDFVSNIPLGILYPLEYIPISDVSSVSAKESIGYQIVFVSPHSSAPWSFLNLWSYHLSSDGSRVYLSEIVNPVISDNIESSFSKLGYNRTNIIHST